MSILFGTRKAAVNVVHLAELREMAQMTATWATDGSFLQHIGRIGMGLQPFHTHRRSQLDAQPVVDGFGNMLTFDGRLDNHVELARRLESPKQDCSDSRIVLLAFERWGEACFEHLVGEWAIALWSATDQTLYLARDHAGTRTLYYEDTGGCVSWGTYLESFFAGERRCELDRCFITRYLSGGPSGTSTLYKGIRAVPPAHFIRFDGEGARWKRHWTPVTGDVLRYQEETQYDEQFLELLEQSVRRRIGTDDPVIAQLSGGMDSSAIVCMSDRVRHRHGERQIRTLSFFDDSEPGWNERPYFSAVESHRGRAGVHLAVSMAERTLRPYRATDSSFLPLGGDSSTVEEERRLAVALAEEGVRVMLSGIGGDEMLGGSLTCLPELASALTSLRLHSLLTSSIGWALSTRSPLILLWRDLFAFLSKLYVPLKSDLPLPPWIRRSAQHNFGDPQPAPMGPYRFSHSPQTIANAFAWSSVLETLPGSSPPVLLRYEYRFPYLDRDLAEYLFRVPLTQMTRPGRRRYMMRRALRGIVPAAVLERPRKGFIIRSPLALLRNRSQEIAELFSASRGPLRELVNVSAFLRALEVMREGVELSWMSSAMRTINLAIWLESRNGVAL